MCHCPKTLQKWWASICLLNGETNISPNDPTETGVSSQPTQFQVPVQDLLFVEVPQPGDDLSEVVPHLRLCQYFPSLQDVGQWLQGKQRKWLKRCHLCWNQRSRQQSQQGLINWGTTFCKVRGGFNSLVDCSIPRECRCCLCPQSGGRSAQCAYGGEFCAAQSLCQSVEEFKLPMVKLHAHTTCATINKIK